jgi:hypothetical protein
VRWILALVLILPACAKEANEPFPLDAKGSLACASFEELDRNFEALGGAERRNLTWEMWANAQFSETPGIRRIGREVVFVVIEKFEVRREVVFRDMTQACAGRASPYPDVGSND